MALLLWGCATVVAAANVPTQWPAWDRFKQLYVTEDGRVVDRSVPEQITTSEGQSYALFFALVANDRDAFATLLRWTADNLADGDLTRKLPAWQWGRASDGTWRVLDSNPASDSDVWIAYALSEAGRLWCEPAYTKLSIAIASRILREEVVLIPGLGPTLLPGPKGFIERDTYRLNASYAPIQLLRRLARQSNGKLWNDVVRSSVQVILGSAPRGFAADWIQYRPGQGFLTDRETSGIGSYNAIRVYLWAGMLAPADPMHPRFARHFAPMIRNAATRSAPVELVDTNTLAMKGEGSPGFSASLLPMLANAKQAPALAAHRQRASDSLLKNGDAYYSDVLSLFGLGWIDKRFRFDPSGELVMWKSACRGAR